MREAARESTAPTTRVPRTAMLLGAAGALPFLSLSLASPFIDGSLQGQAGIALTAYGAVILSFLGGIHWGLAIGPVPVGAEDNRLFCRLGRSVLPALIGWIALLVPPPYGLVLLALAFISVLFQDVTASRNGEAPDWYPRLRGPLTIAVVLSLTTGAFV